VCSSGLAKRSEAQKDEIVYQLDLTKLDALIQPLLSDGDLRKESRAIAVVNTTDASHIATRVARALNLMGYNVINISQAHDGLEKTRIDVESKEVLQTRTTILLRNVLQLPGKLVAIDPKSTLEYRADIVVFLGNDTAELLTQPTLPRR
jgi:hypothetical protein